MSDFTFLQNPLSKKWVILAPRRAKRPDIAKGFEPVCPFCPGREGEEEEVYRVFSDVIPNSFRDLTHEDNEMLKQVQHDKGDWSVRVLKNKFPFAPIHEVIIHSPDHAKSFDLLPLSQVELIIKTYRQRFQTHQDKGNVYIFHNHGKGGGESLPHPHTQLTVVPFEVGMDMPMLEFANSSTVRGVHPHTSEVSLGELGLREAQNNAETSVIGSQFSVVGNGSAGSLSAGLETDELKTGQQISENRELKTDNRNSVVPCLVPLGSAPDSVETESFSLFCPPASQWPDETWIAPKKRGRLFGEITDEEISDLAVVLQKLIRILDLRHGSEFPFNFYIYPGGDWYLRIIPRVKSLGGFEIGTGIFINTQDPKETIAFIREHFNEPDEEKIRNEHMAEYGRHV